MFTQWQEGRNQTATTSEDKRAVLYYSINIFLCFYINIFLYHRFSAVEWRLYPIIYKSIFIEIYKNIRHLKGSVHL